MILSVFICEDDPVQLERMKTIVGDYIKVKDYAMQVALATGNPSVLLECLQGRPPNNALYILDVDLHHQMNGIGLAMKIREIDALGKIVFVTTHSELSYLTFRYRLEALDYIVKDTKEYMEKSVQECLELAYQYYQSVEPIKESFQIKSAEGVRNVFVEEVMFFETHSKSHKLILHTINSRIEFRGTLDEMEGLNSAFYRCHNAHVVNIKNIKCLDKARGTIEMINGEITFVTRRKVKELVVRLTP